MIGLFVETLFLAFFVTLVFLTALVFWLFSRFFSAHNSIPYKNVKEKTQQTSSWNPSNYSAIEL